MIDVIGIDPGKTTGVALCKYGKIVELKSTDFWGAIEAFEDYSDAFVVIELPDTKHVWHNGSTNKKAIQRTGVNVGSCIREAELLIQYLIRNGRDYVIQKPLGKRTGDQFKNITGWAKQTNQHTRDAGLLAYGFKFNKKVKT